MSDLTSSDRSAIRRIAPEDARALVDAERGILVDTRDRRLYDNAHAAGAVVLPLKEIEATAGQVHPSLPPGDQVLILYCA